MRKATVAFAGLAATAWAWLASAQGVDAPAGTGAAGADDDPFLWLEQVDSPRAMTWVQAENQRTAAVLDQDPRFPGFQQAALAIAQAKDRIPEPHFIAGRIYNLWQDADHAHGLWRATRLEDYRTSNPSWSTVLDLDALALSENSNGFWNGAECLRPAEQRCLLSLADGAEDAVSIREFNLATRAFVGGGFALPRGKQGAVWQDADTLLVAREWVPGEMSRSGYPYVIKRLRRGQALAEASEVFRGTADDVGVFPLELRDGEGHQALLVAQAHSFFDGEYYLLGARGAARLALPRQADIDGLVHGQLIVALREDWVLPGKSTLASGSLVAIDLQAAAAAPGQLRPTLVFAPGPKEAFISAATTRGRLLVTVLDDVRGRAYVYTPAGKSAWSRRLLALPDNSAIEITDADLHGERALLEVTGFLAPPTLWLADLGTGALSRVKTLPARFDATHLVVEQHEARSADGTTVPYFIVHSAGGRPDGNTPTILTAYGGFQVANTPSYVANAGKLWLEHGGAWVLANIRGGGEFGPAWHQAGLKTHRQRIYDDFYAVARDLIARGLTTPAHLGIRGGSNGGLLMGVAMTQHPELWSAVDIEVPLLDMLRFEQIAAGSSWTGEYGSVANADERSFLASISPYHNLKAGVHYPEPLIWSTTKDDRVGPQHARKFAARLAAMGLPYLYYEQIEGGHGAGATLEEQAAMTAREYTYFARHLMP